MVLLYTSAFLYFTAAFSYVCATFIERQLGCSSESFSIWYNYDGPLYYLSISVSPCSQGMGTYNLTYTMIPMFTATRIGYSTFIYYKGQLWLEHTEPDFSCEDLKLCGIIKGETLHDTFPVYVNRLFFPKGEYHIYMNMTIVDDLDRTLTVRFNITALVKDTNSDNTIFRGL